MATIYVNSGAAGANNGTSWTDAYTSLASTNAAAAGDIVLVHKTHTQTGLAANINWSSGTVANPVRVVCVDKDASDALSTGASVEWTTTALGPQGNIYAYGMTWRNTGAQLTLTAATDGVQVSEACTLVCTGANGINIAGTRASFSWVNVNVDLSGGSAATTAMSVGGAPLRWVGGTVTCRATQTNLFGAGLPLLCVGVTFSGTVTSLFGASVAQFANGRGRFQNCIAPTYTNVIGATVINPGAEIDLSGLHPAGTLTAAALPPVTLHQRCGTVSASTTRYRTGGADDGSQANPYSWAMVASSSAGTFASPLVSHPITRWVETGSQTVTVYVASGTTLTDAEFWIEVLSPSEAGSPTALAAHRTTRALPLATAANLTTDATSTWAGTGVGTKQYAQVTIAPTIAGPVSVRVHLAKASTTVYVDPVLDVAGDVAGDSRFFEGVQAFAATGGGGSSGTPAFACIG